MTNSWVRQPAAGAAVVLACAVFLAACGGGGGGGAAKTASSATTTTAAGDRQAALAACQSQLPARGTGNGGNGGNFANNPQVQVYYNCLQSYLMTHGGTTLPPLGQAGARGLFGGGPGGGPGSSTTADPSLQAAQAHCASLRPTFGGGSTTTTVK